MHGYRRPGHDRPQREVRWAAVLATVDGCRLRRALLGVGPSRFLVLLVIVARKRTRASSAMNSRSGERQTGTRLSSSGGDHHGRHRDWVTRAYGPALTTLPPATRGRKLAQLTAVTDLAIWRLLRRELGLGPDQTTAAIRELVDACLP